MGARQSKRSVDITTGKEVVVATDGEGKVERIEDVDVSLKPQLNGDTTHEEIQISVSISLNYSNEIKRIYNFIGREARKILTLSMVLRWQKPT